MISASVVIPLPILEWAISEALRNGPGAVVLLNASVARKVAGSSLLVRPPHAPGSLRLGVSLVTRFGGFFPQEVSAVLQVGQGSLRGQIRAYVRSKGGAIDWAEARIVGPGMHVVSPRSRRDTEDFPLEPSLVDDPADIERFSRSIGFLGEAWKRMRRQHVGLIGLGRTGSAMAALLARTVGVLTTVDPDIVEEHCLGEGGLEGMDDYIGLPKVVAAKRILDRSLRVHALQASVTETRALHALRDTDVLVCCVDHDAARLAAGAISTLYHLPLLDIATGIHGAGVTERRFGATVRLYLPGTNSCLLCWGGLADEVKARDALSSRDAERSAYGNRVWQQERLGSLRSLNTLAAAAGFRMYEDLMRECLTSSQWLQLEYDGEGRLSCLYPAPKLDTGEKCALCELAGLGEAGLFALPQVLRMPAVGTIA